MQLVPGFGPGTESYQVPRFQDRKATSLRSGCYAKINFRFGFRVAETPIHRFPGIHECFRFDFQTTLSAETTSQIEPGRADSAVPLLKSTLKYPWVQENVSVPLRVLCIRIRR